MGYDFEIIYKKRYENIITDDLSREFNLMTILVVNYEIWNQIKRSWEKDLELSKLIEQRMIPIVSRIMNRTKINSKGEVELWWEITKN